MNVPGCQVLIHSSVRNCTKCSTTQDIVTFAHPIDHCTGVQCFDSSSAEKTETQTSQFRQSIGLQANIKLGYFRYQPLWVSAPFPLSRSLNVPPTQPMANHPHQKKGLNVFMECVLILICLFTSLFCYYSQSANKKHSYQLFSMEKVKKGKSRMIYLNF